MSREGDHRMRRTGVAVGLFLLLAAGCGGEGPTDSDGTLGADEAAELAAAVAGQAGGVLASRTDEAGPAGGAQADSPPLGGSILFSRARACRLGGQATMAGRLSRSYAPEGQLLTVDFSMTVVHDGCVVGSGRRELTLTGAPGLDVQAAYRQVEGRLDGPQRASVKGEVDWTSGAASGSCRISLETVLDPAAGTLSVTGDACGFPVDRTLDR